VVLEGVATVKEEFNTGKNNFQKVSLTLMVHGELSSEPTFEKFQRSRVFFEAVREAKISPKHKFVNVVW